NYKNLSAQQVLTLGDPNFPDMSNWIEHTCISDNFSTPMEAERLPDTSASQGKVVDNEICRSDLGSCSDLVPKLIHRTGADGGGAQLVTIIALELFKKMYSQLGTHRKSI